MNISRGENWGRFESMPDNGLIIHSNKELFEEINRCKRKSEILPVFGLLGGDLWRTLEFSRESTLFERSYFFRNRFRLRPVGRKNLLVFFSCLCW